MFVNIYFNKTQWGRCNKLCFKSILISVTLLFSLWWIYICMLCRHPWSLYHLLYGCKLKRNRVALSWLIARYFDWSRVWFLERCICKFLKSDASIFRVSLQRIFQWIYRYEEFAVFNWFHDFQTVMWGGLYYILITHFKCNKRLVLGNISWIQGEVFIVA